MASFSYVAFEDSGRRTRGTVDAADLDAAIAAVGALGIHLLEIKEGASSPGAKAEPGARRGWSLGGRISRAELALFTRRMADLSSAGLPLDRALRVAGEQSDHPVLREIIEETIREVQAGVPVSEALAKYPDSFPTVFTMTLRAGEASGQFADVASRLAEFQQMEVRRRSQITASLVYPTILALSAVGVIAFLMLFVVPRLSGVFKDLGSDLPLTTLILLRSSDFISDHFLVLAAVIVGLGLFLRTSMRTEAGQRFRDRWILRAPIIGGVVSKAVVSRYARVLGTLIYGGVPILESLRIAGAASGNRIFEENSLKVQNEVREGHRIADAMKDQEGFSSILIQMVSVGEETGDLPQMLGRVSETLDFEVDNGMQKLTTMVEPLIVLTMGAFVGFVVLSILVPVYEAQNLVK